MDRNLAFIDTETTSLRPDRRAWETALILRRPGKPDFERRWLVDWYDLDLGNADPKALDIGGFYERHPQRDKSKDEQRPALEEDVLFEVAKLTRGAVLLGSNPGFDKETLEARMRARGICPGFHYHPEDVPTLARGWLLGRGEDAPAGMKSDQIALRCGVDPARYERHTALGDCRLFRDLYDVVTDERVA